MSSFRLLLRVSRRLSGIALFATLGVLLLIAPSSSHTSTRSRSLQPTLPRTAQSGIGAGPERQNKDQAIQAAPVFAEFESWSRAYLSASNPESFELGGIELAKSRKSFLRELITSDPARALALSVSPELRAKLPSAIQQHLEEHVSAYGDFLVYVVMMHDVHHAMEEMTGSRIDRAVVINGSRYAAFVYGRREAMTTKFDIPLQGIVLDGLIAVDESPLRKMEPKEYQSHSVNLAELNEFNVVAEVGGKPVVFPEPGSLDKFVRDQIEWESVIGPVRPKSGQPFSPWTVGSKTVLIIRVDFPEKPGEPVDFNNQPLTLAGAQSLMDNQINPFYVTCSYHRTSMQTTVTPVVRMPQSQSFYFNNVGALFTDAPNAARAAGYDANNFSFDVIAMSYNQGFAYGGIAAVGAQGAALNGSFNLYVGAHELGHNYGLLHANLWRTTDGTVIGPGSNVEYGNPFDVMGNGGDSRSQFNAPYKSRLEWLTAAEMQVVTGDGVYRVFAHDSLTPGGISALKIRKNATKNYWIEFRQLFTNNANAMNGAMISWDYLSAGFKEVEILDMTPNTPTDATDSPLVISQSFYDTENRIRFTVLGKGHTTPESLDVKVEFNVGCTFSLGQASQTFTASGGEGNIPVNSSSGCKPPATSNDSWLSAVASDTSPVRYTVAANYDSQSRTGTITVAGQTFTVQQGGATTGCAGQPSGLVAWWRGEGNALDQTGVNNGTVTNNISFAGGKVGGGFRGDYTNNAGAVEVPDSPSLALNHSMTVEGWLKLDSFGGTVIERRGADFSQLSYSLLVSSNGILQFIVWSPSGGLGIYSDPLPLGQFVHFAASLDDGTGQLRLYINGSLVRQYTITQRPSTVAGAKTYIGNINGITDELSVYNRALAASQVQAIYNAGVAGSGATGKCLGACTFSLGQSSQTFAAAGGAGNIPLNTQSGCVPLTATSNDSWLAAVSTDVGTVRYTVAANYDSQPRTGTITVAGQTFTVQQGGATTGCAGQPSGLVAWWRGEGNALDQTGVNNGTITNGVSFTGGKVGGGFLGDYTNNAGAVEVPDSPSLALNHSMTVEGWLKLDSFGGTVIERRSADFSQLSYSLWVSSNGILQFIVWSPSGGLGIYSDPLPLGQFVHFAVSLDDGTGQLRLYINGSLVRQYTITQRPSTVAGAKTYIGNINGITDELSVYNRALAASQVQAIYNAGVAGSGATGKCLGACTFSLGQSSQSFTAAGGVGNIPLNTQSGCVPLMPTSNDSWLTAVSTDAGTIGYIVAANYDSQPRTGTFTVGGQTFTVQQGGATTACVPRPSGLAAWWRAEGNALDQTGVNNGTLVNNVGFGAGKVGGGFSSNSSSGGRAQIPDSPSLALNRSMTFEGWLRLDSYGGTVIERRDTANSAASYSIWMFSSGQLFFNISFNASQGTGITTPNPLPLNQFFHFAATLDDATGQIKLYLNGSLVTQSTITQRPYDLDPTASPRVNVGNINGITDELSAYNRALSASEILAIYNAGIAATGATGKCLSTAVQFSVQTNPTGRTFNVDGANYSTPQTFSWTPGSSHTIGTSSPQSGAAGTQYGWSSWSDGGQIAHTVNAPDTSTTCTANFTTQYQLTMNAGSGGIVSPMSGYFNSGQSVQISATANSGFTFTGWTGSGSGSFSGATNSVSVTMNGPLSETASFNSTLKSKKTGVFRPSTGELFLKNANTSGFADIYIIFGNPGDYPVAGDWNGDGVDSVGIYRNGVFYLRNTNSTGFADIVVPFGNPGDQPVVGDWNGDGVDTIGVYRSDTGTFLLRNSNTAGAPDLVFVLGNPGDIGIAGDWDGDGVTSCGVFRPSNGIVYLKNSNSTGFADLNFVFGNAGDKPVAGDWNGDGIDTIGIYRNGVFYLSNSNATGFADLSFVLGNSGDFPIAGNWNGAQ